MSVVVEGTQRGNVSDHGARGRFNVSDHRALSRFNVLVHRAHSRLAVIWWIAIHCILYDGFDPLNQSTKCVLSVFGNVESVHHVDNLALSECGVIRPIPLDIEQLPDVVEIENLVILHCALCSVGAVVLVHKYESR